MDLVLLDSNKSIICIIGSQDVKYAMAVPDPLSMNTKFRVGVKYSIDTFEKAATASYMHDNDVPEAIIPIKTVSKVDESIVISGELSDEQILDQTK